jgi:3-hydroxy-9,10-secoandrosta-1,3,5(10)-triene-9,17-dione monooxygenase
MANKKAAKMAVAEKRGGAKPPSRRFKPIAPPDPGLTPAEMMARAVALRPLLRETQAKIEAAGRISDEMNQRFVDAGFYRTIQPRIFGGYEFGVPDFMRVMMEVARGCPESGWVLALTAGHAHLFAGFPAEGQIEVYGGDGEFRAPGVPPPSGQAVPVAGGYRVKGAWDYVSGCDIATHFIGGALVLDPATKAPRGSIVVVFDRADYTIVDNWDMVGMQGTGSKRVVIEELFVPMRRTVAWTNAKGEAIAERPGRSLHANPMYFGRTVPFLVAESTSVVVGAAYGALDVYGEIVKARKANFPPFPYRYELAEIQHNYGRCQTLIDTAQAAAIRVGEQYMELSQAQAEGGPPFDADWERRLHMVLQQCIHLCYEAVDIMFRTAGTSSAKTDAILGRYWRNIAVIRTHLAHQSDSTAVNYGRFHFGVPVIGRM